MSAREVILGRIRANLGKVGSEPSKEETAPVLEYLKSHPDGVRPRSDWSDITARFVERARGLGSSVDVIQDMMAAPQAVRRYLDANALPKNGICWLELAKLPWSEAGIDLDPRPAQHKDLLGVTGAFCAIAETGTLMLLSGKATSVTTSLLPETHIAVINLARIVKGMEEAWRMLRLEHSKLPRAVNFVSGPSRTADIEQTIVIGAHGPYRVHIIVVSN